jgi:hypothetical protein
MRKDNFYVVAFSEEGSSQDDGLHSEVSYAEDQISPVGVEEVVYQEKLPGTDNVLLNSADDDLSELKEKAEEVIDKATTSWENDRDPCKFMDYISAMYPAKIPKHDGTSPMACDLAINFLKKLLNEISSAIKVDDPYNPAIPISDLENSYKLKIMNDIIVLKDHKKKLESKISDQLSPKKIKKSASETSDISPEDVEMVYDNILLKEAMQKRAFSPKLQVVVSPFERAIAGIIINSVVAGGKPFEDVFDFLKDKYKLDKRDELAIMQIVMDSGFPIFKDRGTISSEDESDDSYGIEFIKNYFS